MEGGKHVKTTTRDRTNAFWNVSAYACDDAGGGAVAGGKRRAKSFRNHQRRNTGILE